METEIRPPVIPYQRQNVEHRLSVAEQALTKIREALMRGEHLQRDIIPEIDRIVSNWYVLT